MSTRDGEMESDPLQALVQSIDRELAFYRSRSGQIYLVSLTAEALLIVGREQISVKDAPLWMAPLILTVAFLAVAVVGTVLGAEYRRRIHTLKASRATLVGDSVHPASADRRISEIQVLYFVLWLTSTGGSVVAWLRAFPTERLLWILGAIYLGAVILAASWGMTRSFRKEGTGESA